MFCNVRIYLHVMVYVIICFTLAVICYAIINIIAFVELKYYTISHLLKYLYYRLYLKDVK